MGANNTVSTLDALFKTVYGSKINDLTPENARLIKKIPYTDKFGKDWRVPVVVTGEQGATYGSYDEDVITLNSSVAMTLADAQVQPYQIIQRATIGYNAASRAKAGEKAFDSVMRPVVKSLMNGMSKRVELSILYGQSGLGTTSSSANASATSSVITVSTATWAPGIWAGSENTDIDVFFADVGALVGPLTITAVSFTNRTLTVSGSATDIANLDTYIAQTGGAGEIFFSGAHGTKNNCVGVFKECVGVNKVATATSGTIFNINVASYSLWRGNTYAVGGALTQAKLSDAITDAVNKGLMEDAMVLLSPRTWSDLMTDQAALRSYDSSYNKSKGQTGFSGLAFAMLNGNNEVLAHPYVKEGEAFVVPMGGESIIRLGACDISFRNPANDEEFFIDKENITAVELRCYSNQAIFTYKPNTITKLTGIVNA